MPRVRVQYHVTDELADAMADQIRQEIDREILYALQEEAAQIAMMDPADRARAARTIAQRNQRQRNRRRGQTLEQEFFSRNR